MTRHEIIHHRRVRVLEHAAQTGKVTATCGIFWISRKTFGHPQFARRRSQTE